MNTELLKIKERIETLFKEILLSKTIYNILINKRINDSLNDIIIVKSLETSLIINICKIYDPKKHVISLHYMFRALLSSKEITDKSLKSWIQNQQKHLNTLLIDTEYLKTIRDTRIAHIDKNNILIEQDFEHLLDKSENLIDFALKTTTYIIEKLFASDNILIKYESYFKYREIFKEEA